MFQRFLRMVCVAHRLGLPIILVHKFGKEKNMEENAIYGQLDVYYTNYAPFIHHSGQKIFQASTAK